MRERSERLSRKSWSPYRYKWVVEEQEVRVRRGGSCRVET
jgi:hypothetical protein